MRTLALLALVAILAPFARAQDSGLARFTFDADTEGWTGMGANCRASITGQSSYNGNGSLRFDYDVKQGATGMLVWPVKEGALAGAQSMRFWVRTDDPTTLSVMCQERGGGRYQAMFATGRATWQKVEIATSDLALSEGKNDPPDANARLDMDKLESITIGDLAQFLAQAGTTDLGKLLGVEFGSRTLMLDDFSVSTAALPPAFVIAGGEARLDTFVRPQVAWLAVGGPTLKAIEGPVANARALQVSYRQTAGRIMALARQVPKGKLKGLGRISMTISSAQRMMVMVQVEEAGGGKFGTLVDVPEGNAAKTITIDCETLAPSDDSPVKDRALRTELLTQISLIDATAMGGMAADQDNTFVISALKAAAPK